MCSTVECIPTKRFWTPPPPRTSKMAGDTTGMTMSERKTRFPHHRSHQFHIINKVPCGNSPYVRAKHVQQLIERDPERAVALFWAAINAGDRVDSALKDMAVVMKQLNRCDEAIEAIKSFRHLCPYDSQGSLDNLLFELFKKSGRLEEETELLERRLKYIEAGFWIGWKGAKTTRSQGKKIEVNIEQEKARVLGNLAWVHLRQSNYGIAERYYREALSLKPDKNKQCNLALCLMNMDRLAEAKTLLQDVKDSCETREQESYSKSYERAMKNLVEIESRQAAGPRPGSERDNDNTEGFIHDPFGLNFDSDFSPYSVAWLTQPQGIEEENQKKKHYSEKLVPTSVRRLSFEGTEPKNGYGTLPLTEGCLGRRRLDPNLIHCLHEYISGNEMSREVSTDGEKKMWADIVEEEENIA